MRTALSLAVLSAVAAISSAQAAEFVGVSVAPVKLKATNGTEIMVSANKKFQGRPDGFYAAFFTNIKVDIAAQSSASVVFVSECTNYNGQPFAMSATCDAVASGAGMTAILDLNSGSCRGNVTNASYVYRGKDWYVAGRQGYYDSHSCKISMAVNLGGEWLVDPVGQGSNFGLGLDRGYTSEADEYTHR